MATIAVLITDFFEDIEYSKPAEAFKNKGHKLVHIGLEKGSVVKGKNKTPVTIDDIPDSSNIPSYDALFISASDNR